MFFKDLGGQAVYRATGLINERPAGSFGDCVLFSCGSGKTFNASLGGILASHSELSQAAAIDATLPYFSERVRARTELYSTLYRTLYHSGYYDELLGRFAAFNDAFFDIYLFRLRAEEITRIFSAYRAWEHTISRRRHLVEFFNQHLSFGGALQAYPFADGAVPWRYNVLVTEPPRRKAVIERCLTEKILVSAWYPPIHRLFGDDGRYPNAELFASRIINLSLDIEDEDAGRMVDILHTVRERATL